MGLKKIWCFFNLIILGGMTNFHLGEANWARYEYFQRQRGRGLSLFLDFQKKITPLPPIRNLLKVPK